MQNKSTHHRADFCLADAAGMYMVLGLGSCSAEQRGAKTASLLLALVLGPSSLHRGKSCVAATRPHRLCSAALVLTGNSRCPADPACASLDLQAFV